MENVVYYNELYDLYGELLTKKQQSYFEDYYFNNMSFSEMADSYGVSRNAVFKQIHTVIKKLDEYEKKLELRQKRSTIIALLDGVPSDLRKKIEDVL